MSVHFLGQIAIHILLQIEKDHKTSTGVFNAGVVVFSRAAGQQIMYELNDAVNRFVDTASQLYLNMMKSFANQSLKFNININININIEFFWSFWKY